MRKHLGMVVLAGLVVLALVTHTVTFQADEFTDIVLVTRFGKVRGVFSGHEKAGLRFKWPWPIEKVVRYDAREFLVESPYAQVKTNDEQNILVSIYCQWRIDNPEKFHQAVESVEEAQKRIRKQLQSWCGNVIGRQELQHLINTDPTKMRQSQIEQEILAELKDQVDQEYGVRVAGVGIKLFGFSKTVSSAVIDAQKKEREKYVETYKAEGEARALAIRERAKSARDKIVAFANRKAAEIRSEGDRAAAEIYKEFAKNPELSAFLRSLESLKTELSSNSLIILDGSELPAVKWFKEGPSLPTAKPWNSSDDAK